MCIQRIWLQQIQLVPTKNLVLIDFLDFSDLEMLALRQQLVMVANRNGKRLRFRRSERVFWVWLYRIYGEDSALG